MGKRALKWLGLAALGLIACFAAFAAHVFTRITALPHPLPVRAAGGVALDLGAGAPLRVYAIQTGETVVPFGQFYAGLDGWVGARAIWNQGLGAEPAWVPIHAFLVLHPRHGALLVDTGVSAAQGEPGYYSFVEGGVTAGVWQDTVNRLPAGEGLLDQLARLGVGADEVAHVVVTHLHEDHVGGLNDLPNAVVHVSRPEWDDRARVAYMPSGARVARWDVFDFDSGPLVPFEASKDLFGDGSVVLLPSVGHTLGHTSVLLNLGAQQMLLTGDAVYTLRHLDPDALAAFNYFGQTGLDTQRDTIRRIVGLQRRMSNLVLLPPHDPFAYSAELMRPALADGVLTDGERERLLAYQASLYEHGQLRREARPIYEPPAHGGGPGRMGAEIP